MWQEWWIHTSLLKLWRPLEVRCSPTWKVCSASGAWFRLQNRFLWNSVAFCKETTMLTSRFRTWKLTWNIQVRVYLYSTFQPKGSLKCLTDNKHYILSSFVINAHQICWSSPFHTQMLEKLTTTKKNFTSSFFLQTTAKTLVWLSVSCDRRKWPSRTESIL